MKRQILLLCTIFFAITAIAQSGPTLLGVTYNGGLNGTGSILKYIGGDTILLGNYSLPSGGCPGCGAFPYGSLLRASDGKFYGLTYADGSYYGGTLFRYDYVSNTYTVMANFNITTTGDLPEGTLMQASNGLLYGMTAGSGAHSSGTLFSYQLGADSVIKLVDFPTATSTLRLNSLIQASNGKLYGMSTLDGTNVSGTIFEYNISGNAYTVKYNLPTSAKPNGDLLELGADTLYGMTDNDGTHHNGTIFQFIVASSTYNVIYNFDSIHGGHPQSSLIHATDGKLYGTTYFGGVNKKGVLFSFVPSTSTYTDLHDFLTIDSGGIYPNGSPYQASDGMIYGMTSAGGNTGAGSIYRYNISTGTFTQELSLVSTTGSSPFGHFTEYPTPPNIQTQPLTQSICAGGTVSLTAAATRDTSLQWQVSTDHGVTFTNISGATNTSYTFTASTQNGYQYRVIFRNAAGVDTTTVATITVNAPAVNNISYSLCQGSSYTIGSHTYSTAGTYYDTIVGGSSHGCDSIIILQLSGTNASYTATVSHASCSVPVSGAGYQWLDCSTHQPVAGATTQNFTATHNGSYRCVITIGSCIDTTNCVSVTGVGIADINPYHFNLYPNPTSGSFTIENDYSGKLTIEILNILGEQVKVFSMNSAQQTFEISDLAANIYEVRISNREKVLKVMRIMKE